MGEALKLQQAKKLVELEISGVAVAVGGGHPGQHFAPQAVGAQDDAPALHRNHQVGNGNLFFRGHPRSGQIGNLVLAQDGPEEHISNPAFRQVNDLGKDGMVVQLFFRAQILFHVVVEAVVGMAEAS